MYKLGMKLAWKRLCRRPEQIMKYPFRTHASYGVDEFQGARFTALWHVAKGRALRSLAEGR